MDLRAILDLGVGDEKVKIGNGVLGVKEEIEDVLVENCEHLR